MSTIAEDAVRATLAAQRNDALDGIAHLNGVIAELRAELEKCERETLAAKDARIAELEATLAGRDAQIVEQVKTIEALRPPHK